MALCLVAGGVYLQLALAPLQIDQSTSGRKSQNVVVIIARRRERQSPSDLTPHRNSSLAIYRYDGDYFARVSPVFPCRSTTTSYSIPSTSEDSDQPVRRFGYASIPEGIFGLSLTGWRTPGSRAFLISDWGRRDGFIQLAEPQIIRDATFAAGWTAGPVVRSELVKRGAYLHSSHTRVWSHGDSDGCINLFGPSEDRNGEEASEWDLFLKSAFDILPEEAWKASIPLVILPADNLIKDGNGLPDAIHTETLESLLRPFPHPPLMFGVEDAIRK